VAILKSPPRPPKNETLQIRVEEEIKAKLHKYAEFIDSSESYVVSEALRLLFKRDDEFKSWFQNQLQNSSHPQDSEGAVVENVKNPWRKWCEARYRSRTKQVTIVAINAKRPPSYKTVMLPTEWAPSPDYSEAKHVIANYVEVLTKVVLLREVALSSMGANKTSGVGMITALSLFE
jgi:hypothetical protein